MCIPPVREGYDVEVMGCRGTSSALLALAASLAAQESPRPATQAEIDSALRSGAAHLRAYYAEHLDRLEDERVGQTALSLYALLKAGVPKEDDVTLRMLAHILFQPVIHTYDATCVLLAAKAFDPFACRRWIESLAEKLVAWQEPRGDWSYPQADGDLSNTQFAALGLWAASRLGVEIDPRVWERLAFAVLDYRTMDGGFGYQANAQGATGSMTAAGAGVLAVCTRELRQARRWTAELARSIDPAREGARAWLAQHFVTKPGAATALYFHYYWLYGLERFGALAGVARLGEHDWYEEGAAFLVAHQQGDGSWNRGRSLADTCFALLFLARATEPRRGPITGEDARMEPGSAFQLAVEGDGPTRAWIASWGGPSRALEWPGERGRGPRVACVEYLVDERVVAVELGDPSRPAGGARFTIEHVFIGAGKHRLQARARVLLPGEPSKEQVLESQKLELEVARAWPRWVGERFELGPDLLANADAEVHASSEARGREAPLGCDFSAELVLDGQPLTPWLADAKDEKRTLSIRLGRSVESDVIRVQPAVFAPLGTDFLSRPIEIEVRVNGKDPARLALDPDPTHAMVLFLDEPVAVQRIELRILSVAKSPGSALVGIGEVELYLR